MALKNLMGKGATTEPREQAQEAAAPKATLSGSRSVAPVTSIDSSTKLNGKLHCKETIRIDGQLKGEVHCSKSVIVGEEGNLQATVVADEVTVSGTVKGDITAKRKITLLRTARVTGDLATPGIVIEEGAKLEGRIVIGAEEIQAKTQTAERPRPSTSSSASTRAAASAA